MKEAFDGRCTITVTSDEGFFEYGYFRFEKIYSNLYALLLTNDPFTPPTEWDTYEIDVDEVKMIAGSIKEVCRDREKIITIELEDGVVVTVEYYG